MRNNFVQHTLYEVIRDFKIGRFSFDYNNQLLTHPNHEPRRLTAKENEVLKYLCLNKNTLIKREDILIAIWGENDYFNGRSLDVFIAKLRKYLAGDTRIQIENVPKVGFVLNVT